MFSQWFQWALNRHCRDRRSGRLHFELADDRHPNHDIVIGREERLSQETFARLPIRVNENADCMECLKSLHTHPNQLWS
jgi:hypothetical protein